MTFGCLYLLFSPRALCRLADNRWCGDADEKAEKFWKVANPVPCPGPKWSGARVHGRLPQLCCLHGGWQAVCKCYLVLLGEVPTRNLKPTNEKRTHGAEPVQIKNRCVGNSSVASRLCGLALCGRLMFETSQLSIKHDLHGYSSRMI